MNFHISSLRIHCKNGNVLITFSNHISFFYGNTGVGKTTMINLINYALGQELVHTQVVDNSVISVCLHVLIEGKRLIIERKIKSNMITVLDGNSNLSFFAKGKGTDSKQSFSTFLYQLADIKPHEFVQGSGTNLVRITFANYMWFSYLRQDELDNTLFYLDEKNGNMKYFSSRFVLNSLLDDSISEKSKMIQEINHLRAKEEEIRNKLSVIKEITSQSHLFTINLGKEIAKKKRMLASINTSISQKHSYEMNGNNSTVFSIDELIEESRNAGRYEAEIKYLQEFEKINSVRKHYDSLLNEYSAERAKCENIMEKDSKKVFNNSLQELALIMKQLLLEVEFPGFLEDDIVTISTTNLTPSVFTRYGEFKCDYKTLSSSGIKTIFKICFSLAIHCLVANKRIKSLLPSFLIIDTPMKNISERMDIRLYLNLYKCIYRLFSPTGELCDIQLIIIDKEKSEYFESNGVMIKRLTIDNPLIPAR